MKTAVITGASDGIGLLTAKALCEREFRVIMCNRSKEKSDRAIETIKQQNPSAQIEAILCDLADFASVRRAASTILKMTDQIDVLLNNAGIFMNEHSLSQDGVEMTMLVNYYSHFLLTGLLIDRLRQSNARVISVSSIAHRNGKIDMDDLDYKKIFTPYQPYADSKLAMIIFSKTLARRYKEITSNSLHPGIIDTKLLHTGFGIKGAPIAEGIKTSVFLATSDVVKDVTGKYFVDEKEARTKELTDSEELQDSFWRLSEKITGFTYPV